jgi:hypothetical protein
MTFAQPVLGQTLYALTPSTALYDSAGNTVLLNKTSLVPAGVIGAIKATTGALTTLSFVSATKKINRSSGSFITDGFVSGDQIVVTGSASNNGRYDVTNVTATDLTVTQTLVDEAAGGSETITSGVSQLITGSSSSSSSSAGISGSYYSSPTVEITKIVSTTGNNLYEISGYSTVNQFVQVHNKATALAGADVPIVSFAVSAGQNFSFQPALPINFGTGITVGFSTTQPTYTAGTAGFFQIITGR